MPVTLTVKNVPEDMLESLRYRAKRNHRSIQGELLAILDQALAPRPLAAAEVYERVQALGLRTASDSVEVLRRDRDSR